MEPALGAHPTRCWGPLVLLCVAVGTSGCATSGRPKHYQESPLEAYGYLGPGLDVVMGEQFTNCGVYRSNSPYVVRWFRLQCARSALANGKSFLFGYAGSNPPDMMWGAAVFRNDDGRLGYVSLSYDVAGWDFVAGYLTNLTLSKQAQGRKAPFSGEYLTDPELYERMGAAIVVPD